MKFDVRRGTADDASNIVALFSEGGNPHNWSLEKWRYYYQSYPEGETITFVAESKEGVIGHYGLFPVVIGGYSVYLGAHAYISESVRGLAVISQLMKLLDEFCIAQGIPFIVGFANHRFTIVKTKLFKWSTPFYASFISRSEFNSESYSNRPLTFEYSPDWLSWRFGSEANDPVISCYHKAEDYKPSFQLLYSTKDVKAESFGLSELEFWAPENYVSTPEEGSFSQPFSLKIYDKSWNGPDLRNPDNWFIQMADSDTFVYKAI